MPIPDSMSFATALSGAQVSLERSSPKTLQLNITRLCNQACRHCHVDSSPARREMMTTQVIEQALELLTTEASITTLDITGGAPELHPQFADLVRAARNLGKAVMVRHNLTVSYDPHPMTGESMAWLHDFFAEVEVEVVSSLPYYQEFFTDRQRGDGVFRKSIAGLQALNKLGFGMPDQDRRKLHLVYNPAGAYLAPEQEGLENDYRISLRREFGIEFTSLFVITNMPIKRFAQDLKRQGQYESYMEKLSSAFNPRAVENLMCRDTISVGHDGRLYDCDFNQMLELDLAGGMTLGDLDLARLQETAIRTAEHCFGCTAGAGSSCGGALT